jgi:hypothetical protein
MFSMPDTVAKQATAYNTTASGNAAVIVLNAVSQNYNVIDWILWSYDATPTSGSLTITDSTNNTTLAKIDIIDGGPGGTFFSERGMTTPVGTETTITLADGVAGKQLTVQYR